MNVKYSCDEIDDMQNKIAAWMMRINMQEKVDQLEGAYIPYDELLAGYDLLMGNLYFLDILRNRLERLRMQTKLNEVY